MKEVLATELEKQIEICENLERRISQLSNSNDLDKLCDDYEEWNSYVISLLDLSLVPRQPYQMFSGVTYLGNINVDKNSFQGKRDKLLYCLPKKKEKLRIAVNFVESIQNTEILPFYENEKFQNVKNEPLKSLAMKKVFISHSSLDDKKIRPFIDLLRTIGLVDNQIFYSSHPAYGVTLGENIFERLKNELSGEIFALFMLSENFYQSPVCLCEMGAVWIKSNKQVPVLIPPFEFSDVKGVFTNSLGLKINDPKQWNSLKLELEQYFGLTPIHPSIWEEKREECITKLGDN